MRITQGQFSFLPDLTDEDIEKQLAYALGKDYAVMVEYTDDPHPRNYLWEMWKQPAFDLDEDEAGEAMKDVHECRKAYPNHYIKVVCYDASLGAQTSKLSFIVNRPKEEPGFVLHRAETHDRTMDYTLHSYATEVPSGRRYGNEGDIGSERDPAGVQDAMAGKDSPEHDPDAGSSNGEIEAESDEGVGES